jgi:hypothetical protein
MYTLLYGAALGATVTNRALKVFESVAEPPPEWNDIGRPDPNTELSLSIVLTPVSLYDVWFLQIQGRCMGVRAWSKTRNRCWLFTKSNVNSADESLGRSETVREDSL